MIQSSNPDLDLTMSRIIKAPRLSIWKAWTDTASFEQWWIPVQLKCGVVEMDRSPGGAFVTQMSENGGDFTPRVSACFLAADDFERIVFTNALVGGWRPAAPCYPTTMTATITSRDHPMGTGYVAPVMHKNNPDRNMHEEMGTVAEQLASLVVRRF